MRILKQIMQRVNLRKEKLEAASVEITEKLKDLGAKKIFLFGSFAEGKVSPSSDLDFLVVMPAEKTSKEWLSQIYAQIKRPVSCDILVYNTRDYQEYKNKNALLREVAKKGRLVYEERT